MIGSYDENQFPPTIGHDQRNRNSKRHDEPPSVRHLESSHTVVVQAKKSQHLGRLVLWRIFLGCFGFIVTALAATFGLGKHQNFTGARCEFSDGRVVETAGRKTPLYDLARKLDELGFGDWRLQAYTPTGTKSLRGKVSVLAGLAVEETDRRGLRLRPYRPFNVGGRPQDAQEASGGSRTSENTETRLSKSSPGERAA